MMLSKRFLSTASLLALGLLLSLPSSAQAGGSDRLSPKIMAAFRNVIKPAAQGTVQVFADGKRASLGAVVGADGFVIAKASELKGKLECQVYDGRRLEATLLGTEHGLDLAMLKIDAKDLTTIPWSDSDAPAVGSWVVTAGLETDPVSVGVLSVSPRKIPAPAGALGILLLNVENAARIDQVMPDSAAAKAGLQPKDEVTKVNNQAITGRQNLIDTIRGYQPGEQVELTVTRGQEELKLTAKLGSLSALAHGPGSGPDRSEFQNNLGGSLSTRRAGFPSVIQHDTVLKPSECGGPLVDLDGKVIGINIARAGRVESYALPASLIRPLLPELMSRKPTPTPDKTNLADMPKGSEEVKKVQ